MTGNTLWLWESDSPGLCWWLCSDWLGAVQPWSGPAGEQGDENICTCLCYSGPWCNPCRRWPSSRCSPPSLPPGGERSGNRSLLLCSYHVGIPDKPGGARGNVWSTFTFHHTLAKHRNRATAHSLHTSSLSARTCFCAEVPLPMAARPEGLPGTRRGALGSSSGIRPMPGPMWLR